MPERLPRRLVIALAIVAAVSFAVAEYLEWFQLDWLTRHPISTNLLSGIVGFSTATLVVAVSFRWYDRRRRYGLAYRLAEEAALLVPRTRDVDDHIRSVIVQLGFTDAEAASIEQEARNAWGGWVPAFGEQPDVLPDAYDRRLHALASLRDVAFANAGLRLVLSGDDPLRPAGRLYGGPRAPDEPTQP